MTITAAEKQWNATAAAMGADADAERARHAPDPWYVWMVRSQYPTLSEREACAAACRELAEECIDDVDGGEECRARDQRLGRLADAFRHAAALLERQA